MIPLLLALIGASGLQVAPASTTLQRGAELYGPGVSATYQDVEDTVLDRSDPDAAHGGDYTLLGGDGRTVLIRFGDLGDVLPPNSRITDATLELTSTGAGTPTLGSIGKVNQPWGEGPFKTLGNVLKGGVVPTQESPTAFGATWKNRFGGVPWHAAGAVGDDVTSIAGAGGALKGATFAITGLGVATNAMLADPGSNFGFALQFSGDCEFFSSEAAVGKPRLVVTYVPADPRAGADAVVESLSPAPGGYDARILNRGSAVESGLKAIWSLDSAVVTEVAVPAIAAGQVQSLHLAASAKSDPHDHRVGTVTLRLTSPANDSCLADKALTIYPSGLPISALLTREALSALAGAVSARGVGAANWLQAQIDFVNDTVLARSRYSFAAGGSKERVRLAEIKEVGPTIDGPAPIGVPVEVTATAGRVPSLDFGFIRRLLLAIGAPDLAATAMPLDSPQLRKLGCTLAGFTPFPDLTGGGDTRYDGGLPRQTLLAQIPIADSANQAPGLEPTGLLSAVAVGTIDSLIGKPLGSRGNVPATSNSLPPTVLATAADEQGITLKQASLAFFPVREGRIASEPAFTLNTGDAGSVLLPQREAPDASVKNAFASRDLVRDGAYVIRATGPQGTGWAWLRAWQLEEAVLRGDTGFATVPLNFFMSYGAIDRSENRASGRIVTDSAGSLPAKLAPLVDGQGNASVALPEKAGDWVEIDLNRDWTLGEIRITSKGAPWRRFAIKVYQTGQTPANAVDWFDERDWSWSARCRGSADAAGRVTVPYDGPPVQIRYIRLVCVQPGPATIAQIEAFSPRSGG